MTNSVAGGGRKLYRDHRNPSGATFSRIATSSNFAEIRVFGLPAKPQKLPDETTTGETQRLREYSIDPVTLAEESPESTSDVDPQSGTSSKFFGAAAKSKSFPLLTVYDTRKLGDVEVTGRVIIHRISCHKGDERGIFHVFRENNPVRQIQPDPRGGLGRKSRARSISRFDVQNELHISAGARSDCLSDW